MDASPEPVVVFLHADPVRAVRLADGLNREGLKVMLFSDLSRALEAAESYDAVIADISLEPGGADLCRIFRRDPAARNVPLLAFSNRSLEDGLIGDLLSAGAMDVVVPPVSPALLLARVRNLVRIHREELHLREMERNYRSLFASSHYGYFLATRQGRFLEVNDALLDILGYATKEEMLGLRLPDDLYVNPSDRGLLQDLMEKKGMVKDFKVDFKRKDGSPVTILLTASRYKASDGTVVGYEGFNIPLTEASLSWPVRAFYRLFRPFQSKEGRRKSVMSVSRISELVAGQYEKTEELSEGIHTSVWKARDVLTPGADPVVVKIAKNDAVNPRLLMEARVLRNLAGHPGIPRLVDVARHRDRTVLVTRYVEGRPLSEVMPTLDPRGLDRAAFQLMDAASHLHDHHIVHRDIKPENAVIGADGKLTLLDFGIVRRLSQEETSSTIIGTRPYMSPEQVNGRSERRSDIWGLGVVLYLMYTGSLPFSGNTEMELMENILKREPPSPRALNPNLPFQMERVLIKALRKRPEGRYHNAGEMRDEVLSTVPGFRENVSDLIRQPEEPPVLVP